MLADPWDWAVFRPFRPDFKLFRRIYPAYPFKLQTSPFKLLTSPLWNAVKTQEPGALAHIVGDGRQAVEGPVLRQTQQAGPGQAITAFISGKATFYACPDNGNLGVTPLLFLTEGVVSIALALHLIPNPKPFQPVAGLPGTVCAIGIERRLIAQQQPLTLLAVMNIPRRDALAVDEPVLVHPRRTE